MTPHAQIKRLNFMRLTRKERQELTETITALGAAIPKVNRYLSRRIQHDTDVVSQNALRRAQKHLLRQIS